MTVIEAAAHAESVTEIVKTDQWYQHNVERTGERTAPMTGFQDSETVFVRSWSAAQRRKPHAFPFDDRYIETPPVRPRSRIQACQRGFSIEREEDGDIARATICRNTADIFA